MGGCGSGQWYRWSSKPTTNDYLSFSMARLRELGVVKDKIHQHGSWQWTRNGEEVSSIAYEVNTLDWHAWLRVYYTNTKSDEKQDYNITLTTTTPNYGGQRWWFICPAQGCGRRVGVLYLAKILACRHCYNAAYPSQNQQPHDYYSDKAFRLASKLGHKGNVIDGFYGNKPKGMHHKTYARKTAELEYATEMGMSCFVGKYGLGLL